MNGLENGDVKLTLPFGGIDRSMLPTAGGKAANLGELTRAVLPAPPGFCVTTEAYDFVTKGVSLESTLDDQAETRRGTYPAPRRLGAAEPGDGTGARLEPGKILVAPSTLGGRLYFSPPAAW